MLVSHNVNIYSTIIIGEVPMSEEENIFEELKAEHDIEELVKFDETDIFEKLQDNVLMVVRYKEFWYNELDVLEDLERKMKALKGKRFKHYKFGVEEHWEKKEIEDYCLPSDPKIIQLEKIMKKQRIRVRFYEMCWKAFDKQGWNMKVYNDRDKRGL